MAAKKKQVRKKRGPTKKKYPHDAFVAAIPGSRGMYSSIAKRVGCDISTARLRILESPELKALCDEEAEKLLDMAESVVLTNIRAAALEQEATQGTRQVDSQDAKWYLRTKGAHRGYDPGNHITLAGDSKNPIAIEQTVELDAKIDMSRLADAVMGALEYLSGEEENTEE